MADQLHVGQVAGRERVGISPAVVAQALEGPGPDLADREQARVGGGVVQVRAAGGDLARAFDQRQRSGLGQVHRHQLGGGAAGHQLRRRHVHQRAIGGTAGAALGPHLRTILRWIAPAREDSISCSVIAQASASHGHGRRLGRAQGRRWIAAPISGSRLKRPEELAHVVVQAEGEAHPLDRDLSSPRRPRGIRPSRRGGSQAAAPAASALMRTPVRTCQLRIRTGQGPTWSIRSSTPSRILVTPSPPTLRGSRTGKRGRTSTSIVCPTRPRLAAEDVDVDQEGAPSDDPLAPPEQPSPRGASLGAPSATATAATPAAAPAVRPRPAAQPRAPRPRSSPPAAAPAPAWLRRRPRWKGPARPSGRILVADHDPIRAPARSAQSVFSNSR